MAAEEDFLSRWSRRKHQSRREETRPAPGAEEKPGSAAEPPASAAALPAEADAAKPAELPPVDSLKGVASDYEEFLDPAVDENLRRSALKKLFHDPHFNVMDGLDVYIDDYSKSDPVPESMLKELLARHRTFSEPAEKTAHDNGAGAPSPELPQAERPAAGGDAPALRAATAAEVPVGPEREEKRS
jgi:uncharacterized protein DUF3306